jgi:excisionase family DNA binding protein
MNRHLTAAEVAQRLHVDPATVHRWIRQGQIPHIRLAGRWVRISPETVDRIEREGVPNRAEVAG